MKTQPPRSSLKVRPSWKASFEDALGYDVKALLSAYRLSRGGHPELYVEIPLIPPSSNAMYRRRGNGHHQFLDKSVVEFRDMTMAKLWGRTFAPRGVVGCVMVVEGEDWLTKKFDVKQRDADNPIKATLDALQHALKMPDELVWSIYIGKLFSRRNLTHVWLFDLGDVVPAMGTQNG